MATLTIRDLDEGLKQALRIRAAQRKRSMEEEVRQILRSVLQAPEAPANDLAQRIRKRFAGLGDVVLALPEREPVRNPPELSAAPRATRRTAAAARRKSAAR